jgi:hypothetical protein
MLLVPRQLRRVGMTGNVPYYGGRLTPAQAYAASHPPPPPPAAPQAPPAALQAPPAALQAPPPADPAPDPLIALGHLLDTGVITAEEYRDLRARVGR